MQTGTVVLSLVLAALPVGAASPTTVEINRKATAAILDAMNRKDLAALRHLVSEEYVDYGASTGKEGYLLAMQGLFTAFPDLAVTLDDTVAEGDKVAVRFTFEGTHRGPIFDVEATGKRVKWSGIGILRFSSGKLVERWSFSDVLSLLAQLGRTPQPAAVGRPPE